MNAVLAFAITLLVAVLLSCLAERSVISTAVIFLFAGIMVNATGLVEISSGHPVVEKFAEIALFSVLFTDGMRTTVHRLAPGKGLAARAIFLGIPLTLLAIALLARYLVGLSWMESLLVGAVLSPTDPVFAAAVVGRKAIPLKVRELLNVESGLSDGLVLPLVIIFLAVINGWQLGVVNLIESLLLGVMIGILVSASAIELSRLKFLSVAGVYHSLYAFAIGILVYGVASWASANLFLAAFSAGITVASLSDNVVDGFESLGEPLTELLKLAAILVFGALVGLKFMTTVSWFEVGFAFLVILAVRPLALGISLIDNDLTWQEWITTMWFGPKGFASVVYGLYVLRSGTAHALELFDLIALVVVISIVAHSSTDVFAARLFKEGRRLSTATA